MEMAKVAKKLVAQARREPGTMATIIAFGVEIDNPSVALSGGKLLVVHLPAGTDGVVKTFESDAEAVGYVAQLLSATPTCERRPGYWSRAVENFLER